MEHSVAEYVAPGHPDRLADAVVEKIVDLAVSKDEDSLVGVECAIFQDCVFVDGHISCGKSDKCEVNEKDIKNAVKAAYKAAGYGSVWSPNPSDLKITCRIDCCPLSNEEREIRKYSDDQNIVTGYATNDINTCFLPVAHFMAVSIGKALMKGREKSEWKDYLGPDMKILVDIVSQGGKYSFNSLNISWQNKNLQVSKVQELIRNELNKVLNDLAVPYLGLKAIEPQKVFINRAGDFKIGGPEGDNGLSGKKLAVDFYGPSIPIGGGAICGKDPHKIDVVGAFRARQLALQLVKTGLYENVFTSLSWIPGNESPIQVNAFSIDRFGTKVIINSEKLPPSNWFSIQAINKDLKLGRVKRAELMKKGYMFVYPEDF